jgi:ABC-2 type transport system permease protein
MLVCLRLKMVRLLYLGGVFVSINSLPAWAKEFSQFNPVLYLINGMRYGVVGISDVSQDSALAVSLAGAVGLYFLALLALKKASFARW